MSSTSTNDSGTSSTERVIADKGYARAESLVSTEWLARHLGDVNLRILESDEDTLLYDTGHIPGAQKLDWHVDLNDAVVRDYISREQFQSLVRRLGVGNHDTVIFYGDKNNWWATYAYWVFKLFGFENAKLLDGGRIKWEAERLPFTTEVPSFPATDFVAPERSDSRIRAFRDEVLAHSSTRLPLVDVRSPDEFTGKKTHMAEYPQEGVLRGGHVPGAVNVPWSRAANADGTFKSADELRAIYEGEAKLSPDQDVITYCRIGERSSHTWFVLTELLGYPRVRNYDGSWSEWGNSVRVPVER